MPPSRHGTKSAQRSSQPTLSFNGRSSKVTKPSITPAGKTSVKSASKSPAEDHAKTTTTKTVKLPNREAQHEVSTEAESTSPARETVDIPAPAVLAAPEVPEAPEEISARNISDKEIIKYWQKKEKERKALRVHQKDLNVHEKILREWDMSGQYGSCMGITRQKRWHRAHDLGLNPPLVVLAVLQRQNDSGNRRIQRAYVDELMRSRFIET